LFLHSRMNVFENSSIFYIVLIEGNGILGCDAISPGKWLPSFEAPCHTHFKDPKSTFRHGRWKLRNVWKLFPNDEASHPKRPESSRIYFSLPFYFYASPVGQ
jgi:hypothetical protein